MQTPTLTEARRALLELQSKFDADSITGGKLAIISQYLDAQVPLNVENFVQVTSSREALRDDLGDRRYFTVPPSGKKSCGECFKCRNGGRGKGMEHPDPLNLCDGAK